MLSKSLNLFGCLDDIKGKFSKIFKHLLRNHKGDEVETWNTCLWH